MRDKLKELILEYRNKPQKTGPRYDETPCDGCKYDFGGECDEVCRLTDYLVKMQKCLEIESRMCPKIRETAIVLSMIEDLHKYEEKLGFEL